MQFLFSFSFEVIGSSLMLHDVAESEPINKENVRSIWAKILTRLFYGSINHLKTVLI